MPKLPRYGAAGSDFYSMPQPEGMPPRDPVKMLPITSTPRPLAYFARILKRVFKNGHSSGVDKVITVIFAALGLWYQVHSGVLPIDKQQVQWTALSVQWGCFFCLFALWHYLKAQWEIHKEDAGKITTLKKCLLDELSSTEVIKQAGILDTLEREANELRLWFNTITANERLRTDDKSDLTYPLNPKIFGDPIKPASWTPAIVELWKYHEIYKRHLEKVTGLGLSLESDLIEFGYPAPDCKGELLPKMFIAHRKVLLDQAAKLADRNSVKATMSAIDQQC